MSRLRALQHAGFASGSTRSRARCSTREAKQAGIDLDAITSELEQKGVAAFCDSYRELLACIEMKLGGAQRVAV